MRKIPAALALTVLAMAVPAALAQVSGTVSVTGYSTSGTGDNPWRLFEYRDLSDGFTAGANLRLQSDVWWHSLFAENLGRDDQFVELRGGRYGIFKYGVYGDDVVHNLTIGAITPFSGAGTNNLTFAGTPSATVPSVNTATWNRFDYGLQHRNVGGFAEIQAAVDSPFYVRFSTNRKTTEGIRPVGGSGGSPGGPAYELQAPINWTTTDFGGEAGYSSKTMHLSLSALYSKFEDSNDFLNWRHPLVVTGFGNERTSISSDNDMYRLAANAVFKQLPMSSSLALRATYSKLESDMPVETSWVSVSGSTGNMRLSNPSSSQFEGEVVNKSMSAALNSNLAKNFDSKIYWNWYERENNSHHIVFTPSGPGSGGACDFSATGAALTTCTTEFLHYTKSNLGADLYYRVNGKNKVILGFDYAETERERVDYDETQEKKLTLEWKSSELGFADTRVKYQHLDRDSRFLLGTSTDPFVRDLRRFDVAPLSRDLFKVSFDATPLPLLDVGAEVIWKRNEYKDTILGRTSDKREELYLSASYGDVTAWRVTAYYDYERTHYDSTHWVGSTATYPNPAPATPAYMWSGKVHDNNYLLGLAGEWLPMERLKVTASFIWQKTDGGVDFTSQNNLGAPVPIDAYDSFRKQALNLKAKYGVHKDVDLTLGVAYEKYTFSDVQLDGYNYTLRTGTTQNFFSGAYAFPSYKATIVYGTMSYRF